MTPPLSPSTSILGGEPPLIHVFPVRIPFHIGWHLGKDLGTREFAPRVTRFLGKHLIRKITLFDFITAITLGSLSASVIGQG
jgi:hypothetical protein